MTGECPHLEYRTEGDGMGFDVARAFCTVTDSFVQPMRADICNARYDLDPTTDCEFYTEPDVASADGTAGPADGDADGADNDR